MPKYGTEVKLKSDILDFKSDILFFLPIWAPETFFSKKKKDITKKKRISLHISFDFLGQNTRIISAKRLPQTAKNGAKKKSTFLKWTFSKLVVTVVGYFSKKTRVFFFCKKYAKNSLYLGKFRKNKIDLGPLFCWKWAKKHVGSVIFNSL